jgi:adenylosuccinate lyase
MGGGAHGSHDGGSGGVGGSRVGDGSRAARIEPRRRLRRRKGPRIAWRCSWDWPTPAWHVHRNAWVDLLDRIGQAVLTAGKIARDVSLLAQPEVGETLEALPQPGVGASSSMPHKRNPVYCAHALAAATRMPGLLATLHATGIAENEPALGGWQAEIALVPRSRRRSGRASTS